MTTIQLVALIAGTALVFLIVLSGIIFKGKQKPIADIQLPVVSSIPDEAVSSEIAGTVQPEARDVVSILDEPKPAEIAEMVESQVCEYAAGVTDKAQLVALYKKAASKHKKQLRNINLNILVFFIGQGGVTLFALYGTAINDGWDNSAWILIIGLLLYLLLFSYHIYARNKHIDDVVSTRKYVKLGEKQFPAIWSVCTSLMTKMDLQQYTLNIWYVKTDAFEASVVTEGKTINLLLSRALISYFQNNQKDVESILGHELGHVYQGDTKMLLVNRKSIQIPGIIATISTVLLVIIIIWSLLQGYGFPKMSAGNIILVICYWALVGARRQTEFLADLASLAFVEDSTIEELLRKYMPQTGTFNYPSGPERLKFLELVKANANHLSATAVEQVS